MGATTVWERWNSVLPDGKISGTGMNSLNHYAYGAVAEWMYGTMCGIAPDASGVGFKKAIMAPKPDERISFVKGEYRSASGTYRAAWRQEGNQVIFDLTVPFDCQAEFVVPEGMILKEINGVSGDHPDSILLKKGTYTITAERSQAMQ